MKTDTTLYTNSVNSLTELNEGNKYYSIVYNRETTRYAKKHKITKEEALRRLYHGRHP